MTVTTEDLKNIELRVERILEKFADSIQEVTQKISEQTQKISEQTTEINLLCQKLDHNESQYRRVEENQITQGRQISQNTLDIRELKTRQQSWINVIERIVYPIMVAILVTYFTFFKN